MKSIAGQSINAPAHPAVHSSLQAASAKHDTNQVTNQIPVNIHRDSVTFSPRLPPGIAVALAKYTPAREAVMQRDYPAGVASILIIERMNALPGDPIDTRGAGYLIEKLGLKRPEGFDPHAANQAVRDARAAEACALCPAVEETELQSLQSVDTAKPSFRDELTFVLAADGDNLVWNDRAKAILRALWKTGLSSAEIGRRMHVSKNSVVGKSHRLHLASRPSPIRRDGERTPRRARPRRIAHGVATIPPLQQLLHNAEAAPPVERVRPLPRAARPAAEPSRVVQLRPAQGIIMPCQWPFGDPGTKSFSFCRVDSERGRPYCGEHCNLAYVRVRDRREDDVAESVAA
jgi:GcrA cell cycle regulator